MNSSSIKPPSSSIDGSIQGPTRQARQDLAVLLAASALVIAVVLGFDISDRLHDWVHQHEQLQMDEILLGAAAISLLTGVFAMRRWRELERTRRRMNAVAERMKALAGAAAGVTAARTPEALRLALHDACQRVLPCDTLLLASYRPETDTLRYLGALVAGVWRDAREVSIRGRPAETAIRERRSILTRSSADPAAANAIPAGDGRRSESVIRTPLLGADGVVGLLSVQSYRPGAYGPEDVEIMEALAAVAAPALLNLQLVGELRASADALAESETRFRRVVESMGEGLVIMDPRGKITYANLRTRELLGYPPDALVGEDAASLLFVPGDRYAIQARIRARMAGEGERYRARLRCADGGELWAEICSTPMRDAEGTVVGMVAAFIDITEQYRAEVALRVASEGAARMAGRMAAVAEAAAGFVGVTSAEQLRDVLRDACARVLPFDILTFGSYDEGSHSLAFLADAAGHEALRACVVPLDGTPCARVVRERRTLVTGSSGDPAGQGAWLTGSGRRSESAIRTPIVYGDRLLAVVSVQSYTPQLYGAGDVEVLETVAALAGTAMNNIRLIDGRRAAEEALRRSEARFRAVFESAVLGISVADMRGELLEVNPRLLAILGYTADELRGRSWAEITHPGDAEPNITWFREMGEGKRDRFALDKRYLRSDGQVVWAHVVVSLVRGGGGEPLYMVAIVEDITERRRAETALRESEAQLRAIFDGASVGIALTDTAGRMLRTNPALQGTLGYTGDELGRMVFSAVAHPEDIGTDWELFGELMAGQRPHYEIEKRYFRKDGRMVWGRLSVSLVRDEAGQPRHAVGMMQDITARVNAEAALEQSHRQFLQAQKMEAVGRLAGGVAHDFNNMLTAIRGNAELLLLDTPPEDPRRDDLLEIQRAADRSADLTRQLLAFTRQQVLQPRVLDLNRSVAAMERMLRRLIGEDVELTTMLEPVLGQVMADPGQVEQVVLNLAVNARDAMPRGGKLWIRTDNVFLAEGDPRLGSDAAPGRYVAVTVTDTGSGMDEETLALIWEPFFTTKEQGKGTGLGLATVYGIVRQSGGTVWAESEPGKGAAITLYLPRTDAAADEEVAGRSAGAPIPGGSETILVVEDEPAVRLLTTRVLTRSGFRVIEASDPAEALELFAVHGAGVRMVLTDLVMPGMDGMRLATLLRERDPSLRLLLTTGYSAEALDMDGVGEEILLKPFDPATLVRKVREMLDRP